MEKASAKKVTALCSTAPRNDVITKEMVALVKNKKSPMPPKPLWREEWPNSWRITYNRPCVSYREPYPLPLSSVMVSCEKVSCYDARYTDEHEPICIICHNNHLFLRCEVKTAHDTGYTDLNQHIGREQVPSSQLLVLHICICKYDYTPAFGNWQARKGKWVVRPRRKPQYGEKPVISRVHRTYTQAFHP